MRIDELKLDDTIANTIVNNTNIFQNIEPNWITLFGMALNFIFLYNILYNNDTIIIGIILFLRWLSDCLDGAVARKYNKTSNIGNKFDTLTDIMFYMIILYWLWVKIDNKIICLIFSVIWFILIYNIIFVEKLFDTHINIKKGGTLYKSFVAFLTNNSYIPFIFIYYCYCNIDNINNYFTEI